MNLGPVFRVTCFSPLGKLSSTQNKEKNYDELDVIVLAE